MKDIDAKYKIEKLQPANTDTRHQKVIAYFYSEKLAQKFQEYMKQCGDRHCFQVREIAI